jgi:hypothetical protein
MIPGFLLSFIIALMISLLFVNGYPSWESLWKRILYIIIAILVMVIITAGGTAIGGVVDYESNNQFIVEYNISKETIENSITSTTLSGFERVELVKQSVELNSSLVKMQYIHQKWYGITIPDEIMELEPILLGVD